MANPGNGVEVRLAVAADAVRLAALRWQFRAEDAPESAGPLDAFVARAAPWFTECFDRGWAAWVAATGDDLCGHLFLRPVEKVPDPILGSTQIGYVTNFYVIPNMRERGVGGALLRAMRAWAEAARLNTAIAWPSTRSVSAWRRVGFAPPEELLELPVDHRLETGC